MQRFIHEDELLTFEGWVEYQAADISTSEKLAEWREIYADVRRETESMPPRGQMSIKQLDGERRYAVAVEEDGQLWIALWVRCSPKREFFVLVPRADRRWNPHTSYHRDGTCHIKSYDRKVLTPEKRQPTEKLRGIEPLGTFYGHGPKSVGAICEPSLFTGIVQVPRGVLGPRDGGISVCLLEPNHAAPQSPFSNLVTEQIFKEVTPWLVITVGR